MFIGSADLYTLLYMQVAVILHLSMILHILVLSSMLLCSFKNVILIRFDIPCCQCYGPVLAHNTNAFFTRNYINYCAPVSQFHKDQLIEPRLVTSTVTLKITPSLLSHLLSLECILPLSVTPHNFVFLLTFFMNCYLGKFSTVVMSVANDTAQTHVCFGNCYPFEA